MILSTKAVFFLLHDTFSDGQNLPSKNNFSPNLIQLRLRKISFGTVQKHKGATRTRKIKPATLWRFWDLPEIPMNVEHGPVH